MKPKRTRAKDVGGLKVAQGPEKSEVLCEMAARNLAGAERGWKE